MKFEPWENSLSQGKYGDLKLDKRPIIFLSINAVSLELLAQHYYLITK